MLVPLAISFLPRITVLGPSDTGLLIARWVHLIAGVMWIGLLYFFNLVTFPVMGELDPNGKKAMVLKVMPRALWWFRWSALLTVLAGFGYWNSIVANDVRNADSIGVHASGGAMIWTFLGIWTLAFVIEMGMLMSPMEALKKGAVFGIIMAVVIVVAAWGFLELNEHGWESNRALCIGIGGGLGWFMLLNVWGLVWRMQKKIIRWTEANAKDGTPIPADAAKLSRLVFLCARLNFWVSFPMLFFMAAASHYILFVSK